MVSYGLAHDLIEGMLIGIGVAIVSQWIAYPFFPEDPPRQRRQSLRQSNAVEIRWIALRATLIVFPPLLLFLSNPSQYVPIIAKCVMLSQQGSTVSARAAGRDMVAAMFLAGGIAIVFWLVLKICPKPVDVLPVDAAGRHLLRGASCMASSPAGFHRPSGRTWS